VGHGGVPVAAQDLLDQPNPEQRSGDPRRILDVPPDRQRLLEQGFLGIGVRVLYAVVQCLEVQQPAQPIQRGRLGGAVAVGSGAHPRRLQPRLDIGVVTGAKRRFQ
jgi:hypothetical protein